MRSALRFTAGLMAVPLLFAAAVASASDGSAGLDLGLPQARLFTAEAALDTPPGVPDNDYDRVLRERDQAQHAVAGDTSSCPQAADGSERAITGSFTTGIGHSSRGGNSHWNAAEINLCKEYVSRAGNVNTLNMSIHVGQYDGPGYFHGPGYGPGLRGPGFGPGYGPYGDHGMGAWDMGPRRDASWSEGRRPWR
jgi:hypothetical protein